MEKGRCFIYRGINDECWRKSWKGRRIYMTRLECPVEDRETVERRKEELWILSMNDKLELVLLRNSLRRF